LIVLVRFATDALFGGGAVHPDVYYTTP